MKQRRLRGNRRGLTLIELVLTLTILALAGALVSGAFATGLRAWQTGRRAGREELVARIVLERIASQLRAAVISPARLNESDAIAFDAAPDRLHFVTLAAAGTAPVQVSYALRGDGGQQQLVFREYPWPDKDFFNPGRPRREEKVAEVTGFSVKVIKRSDKPGADRTGKSASAGGDGLATTEWSPLDRELPASVSVAISVGAPGAAAPRQYQFSVPILARGILK